jgi:hypothetical protein
MSEKYDFRHYFNSSHSPAIAPIEKYWQPVKHWVRTLPHWDIASTKALATEGWDSIHQSTIDKWVANYPQLLPDVIDAGGKMIGH